MTRLDRLIRTVREEQKVFATNPTDDNREQLSRNQDRLFAYVMRTGKTCETNLFFVSENA